MGFFGLFGHIGHRIIDLPLILIPLLIGFISLAAAEGNRLARRLMIVLIAIVVGFAVCQYVFYGTLPRSPIIIFDQGIEVGCKIVGKLRFSDARRQARDAAFWVGACSDEV